MDNFKIFFLASRWLTTYSTDFRHRLINLLPYGGFTSFRAELPLSMLQTKNAELVEKGLFSQDLS